MPHIPQPGTVVLYDNGWNHNKQGRPHVVVATCPTRGVRLCPLSSTQHSRRTEAPISARNGGLRRDSWVCATDAFCQRNQLLWVAPEHLGRSVGRLTSAELLTVKLTAITQVKRWKARALVPA